MSACVWESSLVSVYIVATVGSRKEFGWVPLIVSSDIGISVGRSMGAAIGFAVGDNIILLVGIMVGPCAEATVGSYHRIIVGKPVGNRVGTFVFTM